MGSPLPPLLTLRKAGLHPARGYALIKGVPRLLRVSGHRPEPLLAGGHGGG